MVVALGAGCVGGRGVVGCVGMGVALGAGCIGGRGVTLGAGCVGGRGVVGCVGGREVAPTDPCIKASSLATVASNLSSL